MRKDIRNEIIRTSKIDPYKETIDTKVDKYRNKRINIYKFIKNKDILEDMALSENI